MGSEWKYQKLKDVGIQLIDCVHKTPPAVTNGYPYIAIPQMKSGCIDFSADPRLISKEHLEEWSIKAKPQQDDIILSRRCNPGETAYVAGDVDFALGQNLVLLRSTGIDVFPPFLRWLVRGPEWWAEIGKYINVGAVFNSLRCTDIPNFELLIPPLPEQKAIAHILGSLDDKIELNRRMNRTLENIAQVLFKSWFVDFEPVIDNALRAGIPIPEELAERAEVRRKALAAGTANREAGKEFPAAFQFTERMGWIPEGWEVSTIGEEATAVGGGTPSTKNELYWNGAHPFCTPKDMSKLTSIVLLDTERHLTDYGAKKVSSGILPEGTLLMSSRAPIGYLAISDNPVTVNQGIIALLKNETYQPIFLISWMRSNMEKIIERANGSTFLEISKKNFKPIPFLRPSEAALELFNAQAKSIYQKIVYCIINTNHLTKLRDTLLPKLISGELRIPDVEYIPEKVMT